MEGLLPRLHQACTPHLHQLHHVGEADQNVDWPISVVMGPCRHSQGQGQHTVTMHHARPNLATKRPMRITHIAMPFQRTPRPMAIQGTADSHARRRPEIATWVRPALLPTARYGTDTAAAPPHIYMHPYGLRCCARPWMRQCTGGLRPNSARHARGSAGVSGEGPGSLRSWH